LNTILHYIVYLFRSKNLHGIHSPFVYSFVKDIIYNKKLRSKKFKQIENVRESLKRDSTPLISHDHGAGSLDAHSNRTIGSFSRLSSKPKRYAELLYRLGVWHNPTYALELGTALGISTMYQRISFKENINFTSLEGNPMLAEKAVMNFNSVGLDDIHMVIGNFDTTLHTVLTKVPFVDWVFFDGNHRKEPTLRYFNQCLEKATETSLFIFDDINWSREMKEAWREIKANPRVSLTIDLFFIGLVFFNQRYEKEDFVIRY